MSAEDYEVRTAVIGDLQWWAGTREFPNESVAKIAFDGLLEYGQRLRGELHVGTYRHRSPNGPSSFITIVGHYEDGVRRALKHIGGEPYELHPELLTRLVYRRARVVDAMREGEAPAGAYRFPHGEPGVTISPSGEFE